MTTRRWIVLAVLSVLLIISAARHRTVKTEMRAQEQRTKAAVNELLNEMERTAERIKAEKSK
jgi:beta-lactamase regulating signal transducer with metallopeptidase domain